MVNLISIDNILRTCEDIFSNSEAREALGLQGLKDSEVEVIGVFCECIKRSPNFHELGKGFHINYQIPQIGKEFDLLKIDEDRIVNIELKSSRNEAKILEQLRKNYHYLRFTKRDIHCFTFTLTEDGYALYEYSNIDQAIVEVDFSELIAILTRLGHHGGISLDDVFDPTNYMISPFNDTSRFVAGEYFLTGHQDKIKKEILKRINEDRAGIRNSISGNAGTGKTLLTYDIAKELIEEGWEVLIVHCAALNDGIRALNQIEGWNIKSVRSLNTIDKTDSDAEIVILDEAQRISASQLQTLLNIENCSFIFSHDVNQKLNRSNQAELVVGSIAEECQFTYKLSDKIRHNKNLSAFIKKLFNLDRIKRDGLKGDDFKCVNFFYTDDFEEAEKYVKHLKATGWEHVYLSNSLHTPESLDSIRFSSQTSAHKAIGQEYDDVVVTISSQFYHDDSNILKFRGRCQYNPIETLFQAVTRTRKRLCFVIIRNEPFLMNCINIVGNRRASHVANQEL